MIRGLISTAFFVFLVTWALIDLDSLLAVAGAMLDVVVALVRRVAGEADSIVTYLRDLAARISQGAS